MGGGCSTLDKKAVIDKSQKQGTEKKKGDLPFQQLIATLPKLFCEKVDSSGRYICSCTVSSNFKNIIFGCADMHRAKYFQKDVPMDELKEIKGALEVNATLEWSSFFSSLKSSFESKALSLNFEDNQNSPNETCILNLELLLEKIGKASIQLKLRETNNRANTLSQSFLTPLFDFYVIRTESATAEKVDSLERRLNVLKETFIFLKNEKKKDEPPEQTEQAQQAQEAQAEVVSSESSSRASSSVPSTKRSLKKRGTKSRMDYPNEDILKFLKNLKRKLISSQAISEKEQDSFNCLMNTISFDNLYKLEISSKLSNEIDPEVVAWIKNKFSMDSEEETLRGKRLQSDIINITEFKKSMHNSKINKAKLKQDIMSVFDRVDEWSYDPIYLDKITEGNTLFVTGYTLFLKYDMLNKFNIDEQVLINWLQAVQSGYHDNPYHNAIHAADVLQVLHFIIYKCKLSQYMSDEDVLAGLVAAIIHDYDHPGLNNNFQINSGSYLATLYNDRAILENYHAAQAFDLMRSDKVNVLKSLSAEQQKDVRETIIRMVLCTDMSQHAKFVGRFNSRIETDTDFSSKEDIRLALQIAMKIADVSNPSRPLNLYLKWAYRLEQEFYAQGDKERELSMSLSPFMDRQKPQMNNLQHAFITYIVLPMFESMYKLLPRLKKHTRDLIDNNKAYWEDHEEINIDDIQDDDSEEDFTQVTTRSLDKSRSS